MRNHKAYTRYLKEYEYANWNNFVNNSPQGSIFSTTEYLNALCSVTGCVYKILGCFKGDELIGGIGIYELESSEGKYVGNRSLLHYNGIILKSHISRYPYKNLTRDIDITSALEDTLSKSHYASIRLSNCSSIYDLRPFLSKGWNATLAYTYVVNISDLDHLWSCIEQNQRRLIKRCTEYGCRISIDDDFESFYRLHLETHHRKGSPIYLGKNEYRQFFTELNAKNLAKIYHVRLPNGISIASQLVLLNQHPVTHTVCAGADPNYLNIGSTPYLRWMVFKDLAARGYKANDLTGGSLNSVGRFKAQLGSNLVTTVILSTPPPFIRRVKNKLANLASKVKRSVINLFGK